MSDRHDIYVLEGDDDKPNRSIRLKKWSMRKGITVLRYMGEVMETVVKELKLDESRDLSPVEIARLIATMGEDVVTRVNRLIKESIDDPEFSEDDVYDLTVEDYIGVLAKIIEVNLSEGLSKNWTSLKTITSSILPKAKTATEPPMAKAN